MKKLGALILLGALTMALLPAAPALAKKPLQAETTHEFVGDLEYPYLLAWVGEISGDIDGCAEWWIDVETWTAWPYLVADPPMIPPNATHYTQKVMIYDSTWVSGQRTCELEDANLLLVTLEQGTTTMANTTWRANGVVMDAYGDHIDWLGRHVHESGQFDVTESPWYGRSIFRLN